MVQRIGKARLRFTLLFFLAIGIDAIAEQPSPQASADRLIRKVLAGDRLPSISVAVSVDGEIVYSHALGFAELDEATPATVNTRYPLGSVGKTITSVAALMLAEHGKLDLDAPIQAYCKAFSMKSGPITVRQLLAHTGGIRHYDYRRFDEDFLNRRHFSSINEALAKFARDPLVAVPINRFHAAIRFAASISIGKRWPNASANPAGTMMPGTSAGSVEYGQLPDEAGL